MIFIILFFIYSNECPVGCKDCSPDQTICNSCDSLNHFKLDRNTRLCVCEEYYLLYKNYTCDMVTDRCKYGCTYCYQYFDECITCGENFELTDKSNTTCYCKDGYFYDERESEYKCIQKFPNACPTGCKCDSLNMNCESCKEGFIPEYYNDDITIKSCIHIVDCPQNISNTCTKCDLNGKCLSCKEGYLYSQLTSECVEKQDGIKCNVDGCLQCSSRSWNNYQSKYSCLACTTGYDYLETPSGKTYPSKCEKHTPDPKKVAYLELDSYIEKTKNGETLIKLQEIPTDKRRSYYYSAEKDETKIILNNDNFLDFQIRLPYQKEGKLSIVSDGSNQNQPYNIKSSGNYELSLQSSNVSLESSGNISFISDNDEIKLNKFILPSHELQIQHNKNIIINEIDAFKGKNVLQIDQPETRNEIKVTAKNVNVHQNSQIEIKNLEIENLKIESWGSINVENVVFQNLEIDYLGEALDGVTNVLIKGNVSCIPKSIKIKVSSSHLFYLEGQIYVRHNLCIHESAFPDFIEKCEKWVKVYNDHPTDKIFNHARCTHYNGSPKVAINVSHEEKENKGKTIGIIVGIVVAIVVVIVVVVLLVYFLVIKKRRQNKEQSSQQDDENNAENA